jgi:hypothetical protein
MKTAFLLVAIVLTWSIISGVALAGDNSRDGINDSTKLYGVIETMPENGYEGIWTIGGKAVNVYKKTAIYEKHGRAEAGRYVEVKGEQIGEKFVALSIEVEENERAYSSLQQAKFYGTVEAMPLDGFEGAWRVNGRELLVTRATRIKEKYGTAAVGAYVEVEGNFSDASFIVYEIEVKDSSRHNSQKANNRISSAK